MPDPPAIDPPPCETSAPDGTGKRAFRWLSPDADLDASPPASVGATAAMAWFVSVLSFAQSANLLTLPEPNVADGVFFFGLGGGAAYLGMALPRRVASAWRRCRLVAAVTGTINVLILPTLVAACLIALVSDSWRGIGASPIAWAPTFAAAGVATALPWAFYHALGDPRVRHWFCVAETT